MSGGAVLLCTHAGVAPPPGATLVERLCERPAAAATALRETGATRVVLGLCEQQPSPALLAELRRAGAEPFGVAPVDLAGRAPADALALIAGAQARLDALAPDERGRPVLTDGRVSRRALFSFAAAIAHAPVAVVDEGRCAGTARCGGCVESCPVDAIAATTPVPTVDPGACTACGRCIPACPRGALRLSGAATEQIEAQLDRLVQAFRGVVFACASAGAEAPAGWALVELPTLALVTPGWLLQLHTRGVEVELAPCGDACCSGVAAVEACARRVLEQAGEPAARTVGQLRLREPDASAGAIRALATPGATAVIADDAAALGLVDVDPERCTLCSACETACPAQALRLDESASAGSVLRFSAGRCVACGRCASACPEGAIEVRRGLDFARLLQGEVDLVRAAAERCGSCGRPLAPAAMRRRLHELLGRDEDSALDLCAPCAARSGASAAHTISFEH
jgi:ferredoxin